MTQAAISAESQVPQPDPALNGSLHGGVPDDDPSSIEVHPTDLLINLIVTALAPMFLTSGNFDINLARLAAYETLNAYAARNQADLLLIGQMVSLSLSSIAALSQAADDVPVMLALRLRGSATAMVRAQGQVQKFRQDLVQDQKRQEKTIMEQRLTDGAVSRENAVRAEVAETESLVAAVNAAVKASPETPPTESDRNRIVWANAAVAAAKDFIEEAPRQRPFERRESSIRAAALCGTANYLLTGERPTFSSLKDVPLPPGVTAPAQTVESQMAKAGMAKSQTAPLTGP